jgi:hypothetical protein
LTSPNRDNLPDLGFKSDMVKPEHGHYPRRMFVKSKPEREDYVYLYVKKVLEYYNILASRFRKREKDHHGHISTFIYPLSPSPISDV